MISSKQYVITKWRTNEAKYRYLFWTDKLDKTWYPCEAKVWKTRNGVERAFKAHRLSNEHGYYISELVDGKQMSNFHMINKNENLFHAVIDGDDVKEWVGIGWITTRQCTPEDLGKYPIVHNMRSYREKPN